MNPLTEATRLQRKLDAIERRRQAAVAKLNARYDDAVRELLTDVPEAVMRVLEAARVESEP